MKKFSLFAILLAAAAMTACTDYQEQINEAHEAYAARKPGLRDVPCGDIWCGPEPSAKMNGKVKWLTYVDSAGSYIRFLDGYKVDLYQNNPDYTAFINYYGSISGAFELAGDVSSAYASINADIADPDIGAYQDVSNKSGMCVVYSSNSPLKLMLSFHGEAEECNYDKPMVVLPATGGEHHSVAEFTWNEFEQEGWSKTYVSVYSVIAKLYGFDFQFATKYSNQTGFFTIYSIGYWGTCNQF